MHLTFSRLAPGHKTLPLGWPCLRRAGVLALLTWAGWAWADVYSEVNDKITAGQFPAAQALISRHLEKQPTDPQMCLMQSQIQRAQGETAKAQATLEALTQEFPELPEPYNNLAVIYAGQQRYDTALIALNQAVRARPDYVLALENLGDVHVALARQSYRQAQAVSPLSPLVSLRLDSKIQLLGPVLQTAKP